MKKGALTKTRPTAAQVRDLRLKAGLTTKQMAELFGVQQRTWQAKEMEGKNGRSLSFAEFQYLQLILEQHPNMKLVSKK